MNNDEAKFILRGYRPGGADAADPYFHEALAQARHDPALRDWFDRQQQFDAEFSRKLGTIAPPADLRASILAGARTSKVYRFPLPAVFLGLAAAVALIIGLYSFRAPSTSGFSSAALAEFAAEDALHGTHGDHSKLVAQVQQTMGASSFRISAGLPVDFAALKKDGCRSLTFKGQEVLEVCFMRQGSEYHLYVCKLDAATSASRQVLPKTTLGVVAWTDGRHSYALVGPSIDAVQGLL